jgi:hypothetical protein
MKRGEPGSQISAPGGNVSGFSGARPRAPTAPARPFAFLVRKMVHAPVLTEITTRDIIFIST